MGDVEEGDPADYEVITDTDDLLMKINNKTGRVTYVNRRQKKKTGKVARKSSFDEPAPDEDDLPYMDSVTAAAVSY